MNFKKLIVSVLTVSFIYLGVLGAILYRFLGITPFCLMCQKNGVFMSPFDGWNQIIDFFQSENWVIEGGMMWLVLFIFVIYFPIYFVLTFLLYRQLPDFRKKPVESKVFYLKKKKNINHRPMAIDLARIPSLTEQNKLVSDKKQEKISVDIKEKITPLIQGSNYQLFENIILEKQKIPYVLSSDKSALIIKLFNTPQKEWVADEMVDEAENPMWFCSNGQEISPVYLLKKEMNLLKALEAEANIYGCLVLTDGVILNAEELKPKWLEKGIFFLKENEIDNIKNILDKIEEKE